MKMIRIFILGIFLNLSAIHSSQASQKFDFADLEAPYKDGQTLKGQLYIKGFSGDECDANKIAHLCRERGEVTPNLYSDTSGGNTYKWVIYLQNNVTKLVGFVTANIEESSKNVEIEYFVHPDFRGQGIGYCEAKMVMDHLMRQDRMRQGELQPLLYCQARIPEDNIASQAIAQKLGMMKSEPCQVTKKQQGFVWFLQKNN